VLYFEHKQLYRRIKADVPEERYTVPIGKRERTRRGEDISVITWGAMVYTADAGRHELANEDCLGRDRRPAQRAPWDREAVLESVRKTSKVLVLHEDTRTGGFGAEIAATIAEEAFESLDAPVKRIAAPDAPVPFSPPLEKAYIPQVDYVARRTPGARRVLWRPEPPSTSSCRQMGVSSGRGRYEVAARARASDRGRRAAARDLDRQGRHRGAESRGRSFVAEDSRPRRARPSTSGTSSP
jgi:hypothetical protein